MVMVLALMPMVCGLEYGKVSDTSMTVGDYTISSNQKIFPVVNKVYQDTLTSKAFTDLLAKDNEWGYDPVDPKAKGYETLTCKNECVYRGSKGDYDCFQDINGVRRELPGFTTQYIDAVCYPRQMKYLGLFNETNEETNETVQISRYE